MDNAVARNADGNRFLVLLYGPTEHGKIFFAGCGSEVDETRNAAKHGYVEKTDVRNVIHRVHTSTYNVYDSRVRVDAEILRNLVISSLYEGTVNSPYRMQTTLCHS